MSSSGKGQSVAKSAADIQASWDYACAGMRGDRKKVIVEEFIHFDYEITLLTIRQRKGKTLFCEPIGHVQERGDYQYSWQPQPMPPDFLKAAQAMAEKVTSDLGGVGIFGVEFFVTGSEVIFSELSPRPHDTGMVTLISQNLSEFDLHARAVLGLPIPQIEVTEGASAVSASSANPRRALTGAWPWSWPETKTLWSGRGRPRRRSASSVKARRGLFGSSGPPG
jgi:phosphoribosylglycinamide formyltransferase 2